MAVCPFDFASFIVERTVCNVCNIYIVFAVNAIVSSFSANLLYATFLFEACSCTLWAEICATGNFGI